MNLKTIFAITLIAIISLEVRSEGPVVGGTNANGKSESLNLSG